MAKMNTERAKLVCYRCMSRLTTPGQICSRCGHDNRVRNSGAGYLPALVLQNQYFVGRPLGSGGFGVTYLGYDLNLDRKVAIKEYFPRSLVQREGNSINLRPFSENETEDFQRGRRRVLEEGRLIAGLGNVPNVVQVYNAFPDNGTAYIVMEYVPGTTLAKAVRETGCGWQDPLLILGAVSEEENNQPNENVLDVPANQLPSTSVNKAKFYGAAATDGVRVSGTLTGYETALINLLRGNTQSLILTDEHGFPLTLYAANPAHLSI